METFRVCLIGALAALAFRPAVAQTADHTEAVKTVQMVAAAYQDAFAKHDAKAIAALFVPDGVLLPPNGAPIVQGRDAIEQSWSDLFKTFGGHETVTVHEAIPVGQDAIVGINDFKIIGDAAHGNKVMSGRAAITLSKTPDGWRYVSITPQIQPPPAAK
jgi:uncharacterized protein (TIGR02246 family)